MARLARRAYLNTLQLKKTITMYDVEKLSSIETEQEVVEAIEGLIPLVQESTCLLLEVEHPEDFMTVVDSWSLRLFTLMCIQQRQITEGIDLHLELEMKLHETIEEAVEARIEMGDKMMAHEDVTQETTDRLLDSRVSVPKIRALLDRVKLIKEEVESQKSVGRVNLNK